MAVLIVISPKLAVREYELDRTLSIGRHESNQVQLSEERASRMHCRVRVERGEAIVEDLESANGIYVNGLKTGSQVLKHNDRITIGATTLIYCEDDEEKLNDTKVLLESISSEAEAKLVDEALKARAQKVHARRAAAGLTVGAARRARRGEHHHGAAFALCALLVALTGYFYWKSQRGTGEENTSSSRATATTTRATLPTNAVSSRDPDRAIRETQTSKPEPAAISLDDQLKKALEIRDRALVSGNILRARAVLQTLTSSIPADQGDSDAAKKAKAELDETIKVTNNSFDLLLKQAREALQARRFRVVYQRCTNLISNDPHGTYGAQAREILEKIDERTASVAEAAKSKAIDAINRGQLAEARSALESVMGELSSTRWAGEISAMHLQTVVAGGYLDEVEAARAKKSSTGATPTLRVAAKKIEGTLTKLDGLNAHLRVGDAGVAELAVVLKSIEPADFIAFLDTLEMSNRHAELSCLWQLLGRKEAAQTASAAALNEQSKAPSAVIAAGVLGNAKNLHSYDFSDWRQQTHWEAVSGSWLTEDGKYMLESRDGGETFLKTESIGGAFPLDKARVSFELEIKEKADGWFVLCEFGSDRQSVSIACENGEIFLQDKAGAKSAAAKIGNETLRLELLIDQDSAAMRLNGNPAATLAIKGLGNEKGKFSLQARQCLCALDNFLLRSE